MSRAVRGSLRDPVGGHPSMSAPRRISGPAGRAPRPGPRAEPAPQTPIAERHRNHFFALLPPPAVRKGLALLAAELPEAVGGRAEPAHRLHLTLLFLGPLPAGHESALLAAGAAAAAACGPFDVELDHLGRFPRSDVVWVGPSAPPEPALPALHSALRRGCAAVPVSRRPDKFAPHVTLLRGSGPEEEVPAEPVGPWRWRASRFVLLRTDPSPEGRVYTALGEWPLLS
ncbi:MAG: RNA 2',3'-cyclic phosphodiesterase [Burkholderiales bacterium]|nr:MAG: RNA 2',3'-cyclic phosphodiesterase [Burkholderiales bacterium]